MYANVVQTRGDGGRRAIRRHKQKQVEGGGGDPRASPLYAPSPPLATELEGGGGDDDDDAVGARGWMMPAGGEYGVLRIIGTASIVVC